MVIDGYDIIKNLTKVLKNILKNGESVKIFFSQ